MWLNLAVALSWTSMSIASGKTLVIGLQDTIPTLDWSVVNQISAAPVLRSIMTGLFEKVGPGKIRNALAESYELSADQRTYTFKLRSGVVWSDGRPLLASQFVDAWRRLFSPQVPASQMNLINMIEGARAGDTAAFGVTAPDARTLVVRLKTPFPFFLAVLTGPNTFPIRQDLISKFGNEWAKPEHLVTLGAFLISPTSAGSRIVLHRNPRYFGARARLDEVQFVFVDSEDSLRDLFRNGRIDIYQPNGADSRALASEAVFAEAQKTTLSSPAIAYLIFDADRYPVNLKPVREAIAMGIDRRLIPEALHRDVRPATSLVPPALLPEASGKACPFDPEAARQKLKKAGLTPATLPHLEIVTRNNDDAARLGSFLQEQIKKTLGLSANVSSLDRAAYSARAVGRADAVFVGVWYPDYDDAHTYLSVFQPSNDSDRHGWRSGRFDDLVTRGLAAPSATARAVVYAQAVETIQREEVRAVPLYEATLTTFFQKRVKNIAPLTLPELRLEELDVAN